METKMCSKCKTEKEFSEFHNNKGTKTGKDSWCKNCRRVSQSTPEYKEFIRKWRKSPQGKQTIKRYYSRPEVKKRRSAAYQKYKKDPELRYKMLARAMLRNYKHTGKIQAKPCFYCGETKVEGHHLDYSKPLLVLWLCGDCHRKEHAKV